LASQTVTVSRCRRTLRGKGHSAAGWGIDGSVELLLRVQSPFIREMGGRYCAVPPTAYAGQYATSNCKPLLLGFP